MSEKHEYICLLGIDPKRFRNATLPNALLAAGRRQRRNAAAPIFANTV